MTISPVATCRGSMSQFSAPDYPNSVHFSFVRCSDVNYVVVDLPKTQIVKSKRSSSVAFDEFGLLDDFMASISDRLSYLRAFDIWVFQL